MYVTWIFLIKGRFYKQFHLFSFYLLTYLVIITRIVNLVCLFRGFGGARTKYTGNLAFALCTSFKIEMGILQLDKFAGIHAEIETHLNFPLQAVKAEITRRLKCVHIFTLSLTTSVATFLVIMVVMLTAELQKAEAD